MKNQILCLFAILLFCSNLSTQIVNIPDANFKAALVGNPAINTNGDGEIQVSEAQAYDGALNVSNLGITDLTGIEAFSGIDSLNCARNQVVSLDLGAKPALVYLHCAGADRQSKVPLEHLDLSGCPALVHLICSFSRLGNLDLSANPALEILNCSGTYLTTLSFSENPALVRLDCFSSRLTSLDLSSNLELRHLNCKNNDFTSLDLSGNPALEYLDIEGNYLPGLDLSGNPALTYLNCSDGGITNLDLSGNPALTHLYWEDERISNLDISANVNLKVLDCDGSRFDTLDLSGHPSLETFICTYGSIRSLGVSSCPALKEVDVEDNSLGSLNVDSTPSLERLNCSYNYGLTSLDVSSSPALISLNCKESSLTYLNLQNGNNTNLSLNALYNGLTCIIVDDPVWAAANWYEQVASTSLFLTDCDSPFVIIPDAHFKAALVGNPAINTNGDGEIQETEAEAFNGAINVADLNIANLKGIETFTAINSLDCSNNQLTDLNVRFNPILVSLYCADNQLVHLDAHLNPILEVLDCSDNSLATLDVQNGNNINFSYFDAHGNPVLSCINVDDPEWAAANWINVDSTAHFGAEASCIENSIVYIPDVNFKAALVGNSAINTNGDDEIQLSEAQAYDGNIWVAEKYIANLTGIEAFIGIHSLNCDDNQLTSLDLSGNPALGYLNCRDNQLTSLDVSANTALKTLRCGSNQLASLDLSANLALKALHCKWNYLVSLDVSANPALEGLRCYNNQLASLDVSANTALESLHCYNNQLASLDVSANTALEYLFCYNNRLTNLNVQNGTNINLQYFDARNNRDLSCIQVDGPAWATAHWSGLVDAHATFGTNCLAPIGLLVSPVLYLQGAYDSGTGLMRDDLRTLLDMPLTEPYSSLGYTHIGGGGGETVQPTLFDLSGPNAIVDWIFLELRDKMDSTTVIATRSALLQRDGDLVDVNGVSSVTFADLPADDYFLVIKHRNHLGVMSAIPVSVSNTSSEVDFTSDLNQVFGGVNGLADLGNGKLGFYSGDFNRNGQVQNTDYVPMVLIIGTSGYVAGDFDLNGQVQNQDLQVKLIPNIGKGQTFRED